jgi:hypothetical protein
MTNEAPPQTDEACPELAISALWKDRTRAA